MITIYTMELQHRKNLNKGGVKKYDIVEYVISHNPYLSFDSEVFQTAKLRWSTHIYTFITFFLIRWFIIPSIFPKWSFYFIIAIRKERNILSHH